MEKMYNEELKEVLDNTACDKEYRCFKSGPEPLCKSKDIMLEGLVEVEKGCSSCNYQLLYGGKYFCKCPLHVHLETTRY
jgi:hypothetical protein